MTPAQDIHPHFKKPEGRRTSTTGLPAFGGGGVRSVSSLIVLGVVVFGGPLLGLIEKPKHRCPLEVLKVNRPPVLFPYVAGTLTPGEVLYVPFGWWHHVETTSDVPFPMSFTVDWKPRSQLVWQLLFHLFRPFLTQSQVP